MFFALTDEQRDLGRTVRDYLADRFGPDQVRAVYEDPDGDGHPADLWKACGEQGWLAVTVPAAHDGLGLGLLDAAVIARAWGAATIPGPWLPTVLGGEAIRLAGSTDQQAAWLPKVAAGEVVLTLATRREGGGWDPAGAAVVADGSALTGTAVQVEYAHVADALVTATADGRLWLVDPATAGVTVTRTGGLDRTTRLATVTFAGAQGTELTGAPALEALYRAAAVLTANDLVGVARSALTRTVAYDKERQQFGKPVGSFQAIKHALADLHVGISMAEHGALYAAYAVDTDQADAEQAVHVAKSKASDTARDMTAAMIQYLGGIGYTWEHDAHFAFKRAKREEYAYGDGAWHKEKLAARLLTTNA
jgi:alkylation response protein AidB-like acyl-CoA dehydrogenase